MSTRNPNDSPLEARVAALEQLLQNNPLRAAAVERGMLEFYDQSMLLIRDSNMRVVGVAYVEGRLEGEGTLSWSGPALLDGPVEITDTLRVLAETTLEALTKLLAELEVEGKITAGNVTVEKDKITVGGGTSPATLKDGALGFDTGGKVEADPTANGIRMSVGANKVYVGPGIVALQFGSVSISLTPGGVTFGGLPTILKSQTPDKSAIGDLYLEPSGQAFRVVAG